MSTYTEQTWINGAAGATPLSATRLTHMEDGIAAAGTTADNAKSTADAASTAAAGKIDATSRAKHAPALGLFFPEAEGAVANGTTDDSAAVANAIIAAAAAGGRVDCIGTYAIGAPVTISSPVHVAGLGGFVGQSTAARVFQVSSNGVTFEGLKVDGASVVTGNLVRVGVAGAGYDKIKFRYCEFVNANTSQSVVALDLMSSTRVLVEHCIFDGVANAISIEAGCKKIKVKDNHILNWSQRGIHIVGDENTFCSNVLIHHNDITDLAPGGTVRYPIRAESLASDGVTPGLRHMFLRITENFVQGPARSYQDPTNPGTADQISVSRCIGLTFANNQSHDGGDGGYCIWDSQDVTVTGNLAKGNDSVGFWLGGNVGTRPDVYRMTFTGNTMTDNGYNRQGNVDRPSGAVLQGVHDSMIGTNTYGNSDPANKHQSYGLALRNCSNISLGAYDAIDLGISMFYFEFGNSAIKHDYPPSYLIKATDTTRNNTATLANDPEIAAAIDASATYEVEVMVDYIATTGADLAFQFSAPTGCQMTWLANGLAVNVTSGNGTVNFGANTIGGPRALGGSTNAALAVLKGILTTGTTAGTLALQWAQNTAEASDATVKAGSWMKLTRIA